MRKIGTLLLILLVGLTVQAKVSSTRLFGKIKSDDGKQLESVSLTLVNSVDKKVTKLGVTNKEGLFELVGVKPGTYILKSTAVGFKSVESALIKVEEGVAELEITVEPLAQLAASELGAVTVTAKRPMVETKIDRTVVNVDAMISNAGSTALEVLEKAPGVMVDKDGNISLKGKQGVIILIDGRPSYLSGQDLANLLRNMPSNQLDQLEIMTQPPAKFDASGNSGVINIKTTKSKANGFNGSISLGYVQGVYPKSPNSINVNWRKNKLNIFANYGFSYWEGFNELELLRKFGGGNGGVGAIFEQRNLMRNIGRNHNAKVGMDYSANAKTTIGFVVNGSINPRDQFSDGRTMISGADGITDSLNLANTHNKTDWRNMGVNLNFRRLLKPKGSEITADADYIGYSSKTIQNSDNRIVLPNGQATSPAFLLNGNMLSDIKIYSFKTDYVLPITKDSKFEAGLKTSLVKTDNNALISTYNHTGGKWDDDRGRSNHFLYDENINAAYVNYSHQVKKWGFQAGLRLENTHAKGHQLVNDEKFERNYTQLFPTLYVSNKINDKNTMTVSYGRRIERPNYQDMNPFQYFLDQFTYQQGNPYLTPQFSHNIELSHNFKGALNTTLNYTNTRDILNDILKQDDATKTTFQTKENIGKRTNIGLAISYNAPVTKWYTVSLYANGFNNRFTGFVNNAPLDVSIASAMFNVNNQFRFAKTWGAELSGFYRTTTQEGGIIVAKPMGVINMAFSKQILQGKGSLKLALNDPFWIQKFRGYTRFGNIDAEIKNKWDNRRIGLTFTYRFGKQMQQAAPRRRAGGANEEQQRVGGGGQG